MDGVCTWQHWPAHCLPVSPPTPPPAAASHLLVVACVRVVFNEEAIHVSHADSRVEVGLIQQCRALTDTLLWVLLVQPVGSREGGGQQECHLDLGWGDHRY